MKIPKADFCISNPKYVLENYLKYPAITSRSAK
jgi:hypothetical protein